MTVYQSLIYFLLVSPHNNFEILPFTSTDFNLNDQLSNINHIMYSNMNDSINSSKVLSITIRAS
jgi:hypothetical protein